jgi:type IV pilus assembly protein PilC
LNSNELSVFCLKLSMMIKSGINVEKSMSILYEDAVSDADRALLSELYGPIEEGCSLSTALARTGRFPTHMIRMIDIGQITGKLQSVLAGLSEFYRREAAISKMIRNTVMYPAVMLVVTAVILFVLVSQVLPVFQQVFRDMGADISAPAAALVQLGNASKYVAEGVAVFFCVIILATGLMGLTRGGRVRLGRAADMLLFGNKLNMSISRSRFASAMSLMLSSGLNMNEALKRSEELIGSGDFADSIRGCSDKIEAGDTFPKAAADTGLFTGMQSGILSAGFRSGITEQAMDEVARMCEEDSDTLLLHVVKKTEPALIIILALAVGLVLLSVMLPLIGMMTAIGV